MFFKAKTDKTEAEKHTRHNISVLRQKLSDIQASVNRGNLNTPPEWSSRVGGQIEQMGFRRSSDSALLCTLMVLAH